MTEFTEIWTLAEQRNGEINDVSFELLAWGKKLLVGDSYKLCSVLLTDNDDLSEAQKLISFGADRVYFVKHPMLRNFSVDPYSFVLRNLIMDYSPEIMIASATSSGRTIMPYVSALVHGGLTADCTDLSIDPQTGLLLQTRPAIGGNILATIKTPHHRPQMATVRPKSIPLPPREVSRRGEIFRVDFDLDKMQNRTNLDEFVPFAGEEISLDSANVVVAGGKGLKNKNNFYIIHELAHCLGGALGSSRPPVDQGWTEYPTQVGLSGKTISPDLYIACGISGTVQHLAGIQTAKTIVAINHDPNAQLIQISDFAVVTDLFEFLPVLIGKLNSYNKG